MKKLLSIVFLYSLSSVAFFDSLFPEVKYSNSHSKIILDTIFGNNSADNLSARKDITIKIKARQSDESFENPNHKEISIYPTRLDSCALLIDLMSSFYLNNNQKDVRLEIIGLKNNVIGSSSEKGLIDKKSDIKQRVFYSFDKDLHIVLSKEFFIQNQEQLQDSFNFCTTSKTSSILINKNSELSDLRNISIKHANIYNNTRTSASQKDSNSYKDIKIKDSISR